MSNWLWLAVITGMMFADVWIQVDINNKHVLELKALQAQVDKKYCKGEVTYLQLKEEFLDVKE